MSTESDYLLTQIRAQDDRLKAMETRAVRPVLFGDYAAYCYGLPGLRLIWPLSSVSAGTNPADFSGQGRSATNNGALVLSLTAQYAPYMDCNGTTQYLSRADEAGLDITDSLTMFCWVYFDVVQASILQKSAGAGVRGYQIFTSVGGQLTGQVSSDGTATTNVNSGADVVSTGRWYFLAHRFTPSTELAIWINRTKYTNTTSIPAAQVNNNQPLAYGARSDATGFLNGRIGLMGLYNYAIPTLLLNQAYEMGRALYS